MKTKAIAFIAACMLTGFVSQAQSKKAAAGGASFGIRAGVNFQNLNGEFLGTDMDNKIKTGFNVGVNAEIPLADEFYLQPGLLFTTKGADLDDNNNSKFNISYLELPVTFLYKPLLGTGHLLLGVGPYAGYAIGGKIKRDNGDVDLEFNSKLSGAEAIRYPFFYRSGYRSRRPRQRQ